MSSFDGKWKRVAAENAEALIKELGGDMNVVTRLKEALENEEVIEELKVTDNDVCRRTYVNGDIKQEVITEFGVETEKETAFGNIRIIGEKISDKLIRVHQTGKGHSGFVEFKVTGDELIIDFTINGVRAKRTFKRFK